MDMPEYARRIQRLVAEINEKYGLGNGNRPTIPNTTKKVTE